MNQKIRIALAATVGIFLVVALGVAVWEKNGNNKEIVIQETEQQKIEQQNQTQNNQTNDLQNFEISDKWTIINHKNFWNNPKLFASKDYSFPNIEFSYPNNWNFSCCNDTDYGSSHLINSTRIYDETMPYIRITDHSLKGCLSLQKKCSLDETIKITATDKFNNLISNIQGKAILPKIKLEKLNTDAFAYKKTESENRFSKAYIINLRNDVIEIDFVNYELLNDKFIEDFLNRISFEK